METRSKSIQDVFCAALFIVVCVLYAILTGFAFSYGDPSLLISPSLNQLEDEIYAFDIAQFDILESDLNWIIVALLLAIVFSVIWFFAIKHLTAFVIYLTAIGSSLSISAFGFYIYRISMQYQSSELTLLAVLCWFGSLAIIGVMLVMRDKILFTAELVRESGAVLQDNLSLVAISVAISLLYFAFVVLTLLIVLYLYSVPEDQTLSLVPITASGAYIYSYNEHARLSSWFVILASIWISNVLFALETYIVAYVTTGHLNQRAKLSTSTKTPIIQGLKLAVVFQLGTLAFSALTKTLMTVFSVMAKRVKNQTYAGDSCCLLYVFKFVKVLVDSIADFALVYAAIYGTGFRHSAKSAAKLLREKFATVLVSKVIIHYIFVIGQLLASALLTFTVSVLIVNSHDHLSALVVLSIFFPSYFIFGTVSTIYSSIANTVILILIIDRNQPQKRLSTNLQKFFGAEEIEV